MRKKFLFAIFMTAAGALSSAGTVHEWQLKEGKGYHTVQDSVGGLSGQMQPDGPVTWSREDDHGSFLNFKGGTVTVAHHESLVYPTGFIAQFRFAADLNTGNSPWSGFFAKNGSYAVMLKNDGTALQIDLQGTDPQSFTFPVQIESNREYKLTVAVGGGKVKISINGRAAGEAAYFGNLTDNGQPLCLGSFGNNLFSGNVYSFSIEPYAGNRAAALLTSPGFVLALPAGTKFPALNLPDPAGTVKVVDFTRFSPAPRVGEFSSGNNWLFRKDSHFVSADAGILHPDNSADSKNIEYDPQLTGTYDLYVGIRAVDDATAIGIGLGDRWFRIDLPGQGIDSGHWSMEQLVVRDIDMTGRKIVLTSMRKHFYLAYLKFIPSNNRRTVDYPVFEGYKATEIAAPDDEAKQAAQDAENNAKIAAGHYVQRHYVEDRRMPRLTAATLARKFVVFPCNWMDLIFRDTVPERDRENISMTSAGTAGETLRLALAVRSLDQAMQATISIASPLRNSDGVELAATITPSTVEYARKRTTQYTGNTEFMVMPHYLEPGDKIDLAANETREFILSLKLADNAQPGIYRGVVRITANGKSADVRVAIKVYNFKLDQADGYEFGFWNLINPQTVRQVVAAQAAYGINTMFINAADTVTISGNTLETICVDWNNSPLAIIGVEMTRLGMNGSIHLGTHGGIYQRIIQLLPAADREAGYGKIIRQIQEKAAQENWPPIVFHSVDEVLSYPAQLPAYLQEVSWQKKLNVKIGNNHIWYKTSRPLQREVDIASPMIDVFVNRFSTTPIWYVDTWETMMATARERNVKLIAYNSNNALTFSQPAAMRFSNGWFFRSPLGNNCSGQLYWVWAPGGASALDDLPDINWVYIIPPIRYRNIKGGPTFDLLGLQAGVTDLRYIITLENAIRRAKAAGKDTSAAERLLNNLCSSFDCERFKRESVFVESKWTREYTIGNKRYASGDLNIPIGWSLDQYDRNRARIAAAIEALNKN